MAMALAALTLVPPVARAAVPDDLVEALAGLRPFDATAGTRVVAPSAARDRLRIALASAGFALAKEGASLDAGTPAAGLSLDRAARFAKVPLDVYEPRP